jgi:hypothetical protein
MLKAVHEVVPCGQMPTTNRNFFCAKMMSVICHAMDTREQNPENTLLSKD